MPASMAKTHRYTISHATPYSRPRRILLRLQYDRRYRQLTLRMRSRTRTHLESRITRHAAATSPGDAGGARRLGLARGDRRQRDRPGVGPARPDRATATERRHLPPDGPRVARRRAFAPGSCGGA